MAKQLKVGGFMERSPITQKIENNLKKIISHNFESFGYQNIETPLMERNSVLLAKSGEETSKQIFGVYGLAQGAQDLKDYSIRFDLTVPLARYIIDWEEQLQFPFKRYQLQKVYRGERQQRGRYKELYQCDIDVIDQILDNNYEIEIIGMLYHTIQSIFDYLKIDFEYQVHINDKRFYYNMFRLIGISENQQNELLKLFDNYYKISREKFEFMLTSILEGKESLILDFLSSDILDKLGNIQDDEIRQTLGEIKYVIEGLKRMGVNVVFDPFIVRGLEYYSGTVFETFVDNHKEFGSICSGGKYEKLVGVIRQANDKKGVEYGGFGGSIGLSRLLGIFDEMELLDNKESLVDVMFFNVGFKTQNRIIELASELRKCGVSTEVYYRSAKLDKQFKYAQSKNIKLGIFLGDDELEKGIVQIKDLETKESKEIKITEIITEIKSMI